MRLTKSKNEIRNHESIKHCFHTSKPFSKMIASFSFRSFILWLIVICATSSFVVNQPIARSAFRKLPAESFGLQNSIPVYEHPCIAVSAGSNGPASSESSKELPISNILRSLSYLTSQKDIFEINFTHRLDVLNCLIARPKHRLDVLLCLIVRPPSTPHKRNQMITFKRDKSCNSNYTTAACSYNGRAKSNQMDEYDKESS